MLYDLIIIGGGASGLMAAITASLKLSKVLIVEKNPRIGKKILVTGNGRCNYTNVLTKPTDYNNPEFVEKAFKHFDFQRTLDFFIELGIVPKIEAEGKTYPLSEQASSFLDVFLYEISKRDIEVALDTEVLSIKKSKDVFEIKSVKNEIFRASKLIVATGGKAMPSTGSNGLGYDLAMQMNHQVTDIFPSLVKLKVNSSYLKQLSGLKINTQIDLMLDEEVIQTEKDDVLFADYGLSGPAILQLSRKANELLKTGKKPKIRIVLLTLLSKSDLIERFHRFSDKSIDQSMIGLINKRLISVLLKEASIFKTDELITSIEKNRVYKLIDLLFDWRFEITDSLGFSNAQATAGGVKLSEINPETMESTLSKGLFFCGEVMDIDGRCGGYNLQWAWTSGYLAGKSASD